jgi:hypothetical protein
VTVDAGRLKDLIQADLDGELSVAERADLARLLLQDPEARRLQAELRKTDRLLRDIAAAEPPPGLRAAILAAPAQAARAGTPGRVPFNRPVYRIAAAIVGGLLIVGLSYLVREGDVPAKNLQGSLIARQDELSIRADGVDVGASLERTGDRLSLALDVATSIPCEVVATIDPATTTFVGKSGDAQLAAAHDRVTIQPAMGRQAIVLEFAGAAPIQLQVRSGGRLLGEGRLSVAADSR